MLDWHYFLVATWQTIYTILLSGTIGMLLGLLLGIVLFLTQPGRWWSKKHLHHSLGFIVNVTVNIVRSVPFIILLILILPFTRWLTGSSIGINAAVVPLAVATIPFYARLVESSLGEVKPGLWLLAEAMGFSHWQAIRKIILPEARSSLLKAASITWIALVGYSAMTGAVGGGGLGQLAIDYGYERFNPQVMLFTVVILVILVQLIQWCSDCLAKTRRNLTFCAFGFFLAVSLAVLGQNWPETTNHITTIRLGVMSGPEQDAVKVAVPLMEKKFHINLRLISFDDYAIPNAVLNSGQIDANLFQHLPFLEEDQKAHGYSLKAIARTFVFPLGFYSKRIKNLAQLPLGAVVAIANDPSNQARALFLLQKHHLIKLRQGVGFTPSILDVVSNPHDLVFKSMSAAQLPRALDDADLVAINNAFLKPLKLTLKKSLLHEGPDVPYANVLVVRKNDHRHHLWNDLIQVLHSKKVIAAYKQQFPSSIIAS